MEQINQQPENPMPTAPTSKATMVSIAAIAIVAVAGLGWYLSGAKTTGSVLGADTSYQAVFLTREQVPHQPNQTFSW
jgi:hypothetical protein